MNKEQKKIVDYIIKGVFSIIFSPIIILYGITYGINVSLKYLFEKALNPLYNKVCKIVRGPIPNSTVIYWMKNIKFGQTDGNQDGIELMKNF